MSAVTPSALLIPTTATSASVRKVNRSIVLNLIRTNEPVSRADLARLMGVVRSTITGIVDDLVASGIVEEELGSLEGRGRTPMHLRLNDRRHLVAGVHVRSDTTVVAIAGLRASVLEQLDFNTPSSPQALVGAIAEALRRIVTSSKLGRQVRPAQVAVALPGLVEYQSGRVLWVPTLPGYSGFPLADALSAELHVPVAVDNDCNLGALSEAWRLGNTPQSRNMVFLNIGDSGVGAGIILNGEVYRGHDSRFVAEFGHMAIETGGPKCVCGRRGCWEMYVSNSAVWKRYAPRRAFSASAFRGLLDRAAEGETRSLQTIKDTAEYLRAGIGNIMSVLNPSEIVLSGALLKRWDLLHPRLIDATPYGQVVVRPAQHPEEESLLHGAVCAALDRFFSQPKFGWGAETTAGG